MLGAVKSRGRHLFAAGSTPVVLERVLSSHDIQEVGLLEVQAGAAEALLTAHCQSLSVTKDQ